MNLIDRVLERENMDEAMLRVVGNDGAAGIDGMKASELRDYCKVHWSDIHARILLGKYKPHAVRRVEIRKDGGGTRLLGIPTVVDRMIQQALHQVLSPIYEPTFSERSYGFRPGRNQHQALEQSLAYVNDGFTWVVDLDMEKFFDRVNHDYLLNLLSQRIEDKLVLKLIRAFVESGAMVGGVFEASEEGLPQGGPLSPLLSNILLDRLDKELEARNLRFVRYADDCSIYVRSEKAGHRVLESVTAFVEKKLKLRVNRTKSGVRRPSKFDILGHGFYKSAGRWALRIAEKSYRKVKAKIREITRKTRPFGMQTRLRKLGDLTRGWMNYFKLADGRKKLLAVDQWTRRRLRCCQWHDWKRVRTRVRELQKLGASHDQAFQWACTRKGGWRTAGSPILSTTLTDKHLQRIGYESFVQPIPKR
jgi:group II intron reverse transcriptase/maturase